MKGLRSIASLLLCSVVLGFAQTDSAFVNIHSVNPSVALDIRYATANNFLKQPVYKQARCFVRYSVAQKLDSIQKELQSLGLGLLIFDGYRPLSVQKQMWEVMPDPRYVADPKNGSRHNRGAAVDLTFVDAQGNALKMPTDYDDFSPKAHHNYMDLSTEVRQNRWILKTIMEKYGFLALESEWWHYDLKGWHKYAIQDVSFRELDNMTDKE